MQRPKIIIATVAVATAAAIGGVTAAVASGSPASNAAPASNAPANSGAGAVRTAQVTFNGKTETILVTGQGLPLYYYQPDSATSSMVTGQLAAIWPPLTSASPSGTGLSGKLTAVMDTHGSQVAYNGHLLYTFVTDKPGQVTGQGVQNFFVATPGMAPITGASTPANTTPASGGYGY